MATNRKSNEDDEPNGAPETDRWYSLTLGSSFVDHRPSPKFCTLRYEFKPASIDKNQPGLLHKSKDNRVALEFHNNQHGKPKVTFEGVSEDHKKDEAVLFFDGEGFRLERLHRAVKRLRHVRLPGESAAPVAAVTSTSVSAVESYSPPTGGKRPKLQSLNKDILPNMPPVELKEIDINSLASLDPGPKPETSEDLDCPPSLPNPPTASPDAQRSDEMEEEVDVVIDDDDNEDDGDNDDDISEKGRSPGKEFHTGIDINLPHPGDMDDEIADADISDDVMYNGPNAAKALRGQVNAEVGEKHTDMDDEVVDVSDDVIDNGPNAAEALKAQVNAEVGEKQTYLDDEIVDVSDDVMDNGPNAAEALRAQVNAEVGEKETSSSNDTSGSESSSGSAPVTVTSSSVGAFSPPPAPAPPAPPSGGGSASPPPTSTSTKKSRGRPPGSSKKQQLDALGAPGFGFTPHVITVKAGEDVWSKIMSFSQNGPRAVCILSATGAISNVTLRQPATSGGTVTYEGRFEILSLSGSFLLSEIGGQRSRTGGLSVSLSGPDGRVLGGGVAGLLTAACPVQVVVGSFVADGRKESKTANQMDPLSVAPKFDPGSGPTGASSPQSRGTLSESSGGPGSPLNQSTGACNNNNLQGMSSMPWK